MLDEEGEDSLAIELLNFPNSYADRSVIALVSLLFRIRINLFKKENLHEPCLAFNDEAGNDNENFQDSLNLLFTGPLKGGHYDLISYHIPNSMLS